MQRVLVWNRYWSTLGGGERFAAGLAVALRDLGLAVTLLTDEDLDLDAVGTYLQLDLSDIEQTRRAHGDVDGVESASAGFDLFVNVSYSSSERGRARRNVYVTHFPTVADKTSRLVDLLARGGRRLGVGGTTRFVAGFHPQEGRRAHRIRWTGATAALTLSGAPNSRGAVDLVISRAVPAAVDVTVSTAGAPPTTHRLSPAPGRFARRIQVIAVPVSFDATGSARVDLTTPTFTEAGPDSTRSRVLGVPVVGAVSGSAWRRHLGRIVPGLLDNDLLGFLDSYDEVLANSTFTAGWIQRRWGRSAPVLHPPVVMQTPGTKGPSILSVGRFFAPEAGHGKRQLEMVHAFRQLHETCPAAADWTLHLVGGCAPEGAEYLRAVQAAAEGLPVEFHVGASAEDLRATMAAASICWHAAGLGADADRRPDQLEHFGITTVEAASAGAVPVVFAAAGQLEVVTDGRNGRHFTTLDELVTITGELIADDVTRTQLSTAAMADAAEFGMPAFTTAVNRVILGRDD